MTKIQTTLTNFSVSEAIGHLCSEIEHRYKLFIDSNGTIYPDINACPLCDSKLSRNGSNPCKNSKVTLFGLNLKKGRLVCTNSDCKFQICTDNLIVDAWLEVLNNIIYNEIIDLSKNKLSNKKIADHIKKNIGIVISPEYVRLRRKSIIDGLMFPEYTLPCSNVIVHDEQFVKIKGKEMKRISVIDAHNPNVYYDELEEDRSYSTIVNICNKIKDKGIEVKAVVSDGLAAAKKAYKFVFPDAVIQNCLHHLFDNVKDAYKKSVGYGKARAILPLDHLIGFLSLVDVFFDHQREIIYLRQLQEKRNEHINRINKEILFVEKKKEYIDDYKLKYDSLASEYLFEVNKIQRRKNGIKPLLRTIEEAEEIFKRIQIENVFPKMVEKQIKRLEKDWTYFTYCLIDDDIPATSNKVEQFYALTLNWIDKNNLQSVKQFYDLQKLNLYERYSISLIKQGSFLNFLKITFKLQMFFS